MKVLKVKKKKKKKKKRNVTNERKEGYYKAARNLLLKLKST